MYLLTFCHCLQTRGGFLPTVFFFLIASVEAFSLSPTLHPHSPPSNFPHFANNVKNIIKINDLTKFFIDK